MFLSVSIIQALSLQCLLVNDIECVWIGLVSAWDRWQSVAYHTQKWKIRFAGLVAKGTKYPQAEQDIIQSLVCLFIYSCIFFFY